MSARQSLSLTEAELVLLWNAVDRQETRARQERYEAKHHCGAGDTAKLSEDIRALHNLKRRLTSLFCKFPSAERGA